MNYKQAESDYINSRMYFNITTTTAESIIYEESQMMYEDELLTVCIAYNAIANGDKDDTWFPHFGVYVYGPEQPGYSLDAIVEYDNNVKYLRFRIPSDGRYKIQVYQLSNFTHSNPYYVGFSYHIADTY